MGPLGGVGSWAVGAICAFAFVIGSAIVKERLFDITLIVKRSALY